MQINRVYVENCLDTLERVPSEFFHVCITSPPYYQQCDYREEDQIGLEASPEDYLRALCDVFDGVYRSIVDRGCLWVIIGETYNNFSYVRSGSKDRKAGVSYSRRKLVEGYREKEPLMIPFRLIEALRSRGWVHRSINIWDKGIVGQPKTSDKPILSHEYILQFVKFKANGRPYANCLPMPSSVIKAVPESYAGHPCPFPSKLIEPFLLASSKENEIVYDPFFGVGTTGLTAHRLGRRWFGSELNSDYADLANERLEPYLVRQSLFA